MKRETDHLEVAKTIIAGIGVAGALLGGVIGYLDYRSRATLQHEQAEIDARNQVLQSLNGARLQYCGEIAEAAAGFFSATDQTEFEAKLTAFAELKHGKALTIMDKSVLGKMVALYKSASEFHSSNVGEIFRNDVRKNLCNLPFEVVLACRRQIAEGFGSQSRIETIDPNFAVYWTKETCETPPAGNLAKTLPHG